MPYCRNCSAPLPEDAVFCPSCGAKTEVRAQFTPDIRETTGRYLVIGLVGAFLSVMISSFTSTANINMYFIPSFVSSIFIIYIYKVNDFREALIAAFMVYLFADGILGTLVLGQYYWMHEEIGFTPEFLDVLLYPFTAISAFVAAYIGIRLRPKGREEPFSVSHKREEGPGGVIYNV